MEPGELNTEAGEWNVDFSDIALIPLDVEESIMCVTSKHASATREDVLSDADQDG